MKNSRIFKFVIGLSLALLAILAFIPAARAYIDYEHGFSISGPKNWVVLPEASVPGNFRFGWTSPEWSKKGANGVWGASINVFIQEVGGNSAKELLDKNISVINGVMIDKQQVKVDERAKIKVVKQQLFTMGPNQGFIMEVVGNGTGFAIGVPITNKGQGSALKLVPTRQRWYCVVKGNTLIGVLSTCPDSLYSKYSPTFSATEATLKIR